MVAPLIRADGFVAPCIPTLAAKAPAGPDWVHEIKHDGYRLIVRRDGAAVRLFTRRGYAGPIAIRRSPLPPRSCVPGRSRSTARLWSRAPMASPCSMALHRRRRATDAMLYAFDLLELNGKDLRSLPLEERKAKLAKLLVRSSAGIVFNEHTDENGATVFEHACRFGFEGIVSKRLTAPYRSGPSWDWIKVKNPDSPAMRRARTGLW
jgi:bifunctional non-homologous end joining protein LigD